MIHHRRPTTSLIAPRALRAAKLPSSNDKSHLDQSNEYRRAKRVRDKTDDLDAARDDPYDDALRTVQCDPCDVLDVYLHIFLHAFHGDVRFFVLSDYPR
jgi:hypothetical protein